jgi:hypothetical protein
LPVSDPNNITPIINAVLRLHPKSVCDLGIGFGKYGVLLREYLDIEPGRLKREDWKTFILGFEAFAEYQNPNWQQYTGVLTWDFTLTPYQVKDFDVVLMVDSLEHIDKVKGMDFLLQIIQQNKNVIVSCPDGDYPQGAVNGNEYERHRAVWLARDFDMLGGTQLHRGVCSVYHFKGQNGRPN